MQGIIDITPHHNYSIEIYPPMVHVHNKKLNDLEKKNNDGFK